MIKQNLPYMIMMGLASIAALVYGLVGILNKEKINNASNFYKSINVLIGGIVLTILSVFYIYNVTNWTGAMSENSFYKFITIGMITFFFVGGLHGIIYKKQINDPIYFKFSRQGVILSLMGVIYLVLFWFIWHR